MALVNCPQCSTKISSKATSCPKCGHPISKLKPSTTAAATIAVLGGLVFLWLWFGTQGYFFFSGDTAIFGALLVSAGVIEYGIKYMSR